MKIACSAYTSIDHAIIEEATALGFPLTGSTALEIYGSHYNKPFLRKRSQNDIDLLAKDKTNVAVISSALLDKFQKIPELGIKIDCYITESGLQNTQVIDGVLCASLGWIYWSKLTRFEEKDKQDLLWIESLPIDLDALADEIESYGLTEDDIANYNSLHS